MVGVRAVLAHTRTGLEALGRKAAEPAPHVALLAGQGRVFWVLRSEVAASPFPYLLPEGPHPRAVLRGKRLHPLSGILHGRAVCPPFLVGSIIY